MSERMMRHILSLLGRALDAYADRRRARGSESGARALVAARHLIGQGVGMTETASSNHTHTYDSDGSLVDCSDHQVITDEFGNDTGHRACLLLDGPVFGVIPPRSQLLADADTIINGDRNNQYGPPTQDFARTAAMWSAYLGVPLEPHDVAAMMMLLKVSRIRWSPEKRDHWLDAAGYAACGWECADELGDSAGE